jgi:type VI secretion system protein ImpH
MAGFGWQREKSVRDWLLAEPYRFDFYQAVRLLEIVAPEAASPGESSEPEKEAVRFLSRVGLDFPASDIQQIAPTSPPQMTVNFLGLAGSQGPLPGPDTERIIERVWHKDLAMRDFLDIFNHRLVSLLYRVRKLHRVGLSARTPNETPIARYLYSAFGLGLSPLRNRLPTCDPALLHFSGILAQQPRSSVGLERLLTDQFQVRMIVKQFVGVWRTLEPDQWTKIGRAGRNQVLGQTAVAGTRVWDQQGRFEVQLGPMKFARFLDFLPLRRGWAPLCALTRFYAGQQFDFSFRLVLKREDVPQTHLGKSRLGWTSWLKTAPFTADDSQVRLYP